MKRRKFLLFWNALQATFNLYLLSFLLLHDSLTEAAIVPPPWSDPAKNPCASYPCPDTMELSPTATVSSVGSKKGQRIPPPIAECRCPPGTALSVKTNQCHAIFERGPCGWGEYFSPMADGNINARRTIDTYQTQHRHGECRKPSICPDGMLYWPKDNKCYSQFTKGPCGKGTLLDLTDEGLTACKCENTGTLRNYFYELEETCHELYTRGPCLTPGHLFLPGGRCDCQTDLPHYNDDYKMCFELNTVGPCLSGHVYYVPDNATRAQCQCKEGYVPWTNGLCYRLYTRGPCAGNEFLINATSCVTNFCGKSRLYFPDQNSCYRIGSQGPCALHQVVVFDFTARPSIDGISYNGLCGCSGVISNLDQKCNSNEGSATNVAGGMTITELRAPIKQMNTCEATPGMVELNGECYKLYTRGPCGPGQWLEPLKTHVDNNVGKNVPLVHLYNSSKAKCVCRPGYTKAEDEPDADSDSESAIETWSSDKAMKQRCNAPNFGLARWFLEIIG